MRLLIDADQTNHMDLLGTYKHDCDPSTMSIQPSSEPGSPPGAEDSGQSSSPGEMGSTPPRERFKTHIIISDRAGQMLSESEVDDGDQTSSNRTIVIGETRPLSTGSRNGSILEEKDTAAVGGKAITSVYITEPWTVTEGHSSALRHAYQDSSIEASSSQTDLEPSTTAIIERLEETPRYSTSLSVTLQQPHAANMAETCGRLQNATHTDTKSNSVPPTNGCEVGDVNGGGSLQQYVNDEPRCNCLQNIFDPDGYTERSSLTKNSFNTDTKQGTNDICLEHQSFVNEGFLNSEKHDSQSASPGSVRQATCPYSTRNGSNTKQVGHKGTKDNPVSMQEDVIVEVVPQYLQSLIEGMDVCGDEKHLPDSRPVWLDMDKFHRGQRFAMKYLFGLVYAEMISLMMLFSFPDALEPLVFTGKSDTPFKSYRRYLSTVTRVISWYRGDVWTPNTEASNNLQIVRIMHSGIRHRLNTAKPDELARGLKMQNTPMWSTLTGAIQSDFRTSQPTADPAQCPYLRSRTDRLFVNQTDMAVTQFGFVGLMILYPDRLGAYGAKDEDLEGFVHFWRGIGYLLGIADKYNFCSGNLEEVRQRSRDLIEYCVKPNMQHVTQDWEHMHRCVVEGISYYVPGTSFESSLLYLCRLLDLDMPQLRARLNLWQKFLYFLTIFVLCFLLRLPGSLAYHNWLLRLAIKKAQKTSPEKLHKMQTRVYSYQKQPAPVSHVQKCDDHGHCSIQPTNELDR